MSDNVLEVEGGLYEYSQILDALPAIILYDFAQAFASLSHSWIWSVLGELGLDPRLIRFVQILYADLYTGIFHNGIRHPGFIINSGSRAVLFQARCSP